MTTNELNNFAFALGISESGNNYYNDTGNYWGKYQFGEARRKDIEALLGLPHLTREQFTPEIQEKFFQVHINDLEQKIYLSNLNKYIGNGIKGKTNNLVAQINMYGLIAGAHLGGMSGLKKYFNSNGNYDPKDKFGTHISDYIAKFSLLEKKKYI